MKTKIVEKGLVKKMREIREKLSLEIMDMSFEQEKEHIKTQLAEMKLKKQSSQLESPNL
jgi:hypothetical protein